MPLNGTVPATCRQCGDGRIARPGRGKYCSLACYRQSRRAPDVARVCHHCGEPIIRKPRDDRRSRVYCSLKCRAAAQVGGVTTKRTPTYPLGTQVGAWTVIGEAEYGRYSGTGNPTNTLAYLCRCACGTERVIVKSALHGTGTRSCGCLASVTHGGARRGQTEALYGIWTHIRDRCQRPTTSNYANYGGRGIFVCPEWNDSYPAFRAWGLAVGYQTGLTIDRIDNDGPYAPWNCRWATTAEQALNTRQNHHVTAFGETKTMKEWADDARCPVSYYTLRSRLRYGWDPEDAIALTHQPHSGHHPSAPA